MDGNSSSTMSNKVKLLCVKVKPEENADAVKTRVLRHLKSVEKASGSDIGLPGKNDCDSVHLVHDLDADSVLRVVSNSNYIGFLLKDGRVCRMRCTSRADVDARANVRYSTRPSFQVLSDAEYAKQLQAEYNTEGGTSAGPFSRSYGDLDWITRGVIDHSSPDREFYMGLARPLAEQEQDDAMPATSSHRATPFHSRSSPPRSPPPSYDALRVDSGWTLRMSPTEPYGEGADVKGKKKAEKSSWPVLGELEWMVVKQKLDNPAPATGFVAIAALHSEFLLVDDTRRQLYSWPCDPVVNYPSPHACIETLGLCNERIMLVESSDIRACVVTESGKAATFYDKLLRDCTPDGPPSLIQSLSHEAQEFPEFTKDPIVKVSVSNFITTAVTSSGQVYWWGLCPQAQRSDHGSSHHPSPSSLKGAITEGCLVRLKNGPPCGPNAIVFHNCPTTGPCVGRTVSILERTSIDPKSTVMVKAFAAPAVGAAKPSKRTSSMTTRSATQSSSVPSSLSPAEQFSDLKLWKVSDVVFLDDSPAILGRAVAIDQQQAVIDISYDPSTQTSSKSSLKVFKLSELEMCLEQSEGESPALGNMKSKGSRSKKAGGAPTPVVSPAPIIGRAASRHVAGIVQHTPVNILDTSCSKTSHHTSGGSTCSSEDESTSSLRICGHRPLSVLSGDEGPTLLVERLSDQKAFLVCSSHASEGPFNSTSFVAVGRGKKDSRPHRCTVEEEGVSSLEAGLVQDQELVSLCRRIQGTATQQHGSGNHLNEGKSCVAGVLGNSCSVTSLIPLYHSRLLLKDASGILHPLTDGLRLKPTRSGGSYSKTYHLSCPYTSVTSRLHAVTKDTNVLLFVLVPKKTILMPHVLAGNLPQVEAILSQLCRQVTLECILESTSNREQSYPNGNSASSPHSSPKQSGDGSKRIHSSPQHEGGPSKRLKIDLSTSEGSHVFLSNNAEETPSTLPVDCLLERTAGNASVLHICCQLDPTEEKEGRQAVPPQEQNCKFKFNQAAGERSLLKQTVAGQPSHPDKSFEELRYHYQTSDPPPPSSHTATPLPLDKPAQRRLAILDRLLCCRDLEPVILKLLCSANIEGHTPFMAAVVNRNYAAALKILSFVERQGSNGLTPDNRPSSPLFKHAVLGASQDMTPLQLLFSSLTSVYDSHTKLLHVSNVPPGFTAQQLLKLFQTRYPSVYKAEVYKTPSQGSAYSDSSPSSSDSDDSGANGLGQRSRESVGVSFFPPTSLSSGLGVSSGRTSRTSRALQRMIRSRRRNRRAHIFEAEGGSGGHLKGVVHFADVTQLRAAVREMQEFRVTSSLSRTTAFGHTASMSVLRVHMSNSEDEEGEGQSHQLGPRAARIRRKESQKKLLSDDEFSSYKLALELLNRLLSYHDVATTVDCVGETVLASLIHNPKCLAALKDHQHPPKQTAPTSFAASSTGSQHHTDSIASIFSQYRPTLFGLHHSLSNDDLGRTLFIATQMLNTNNAFVAGQQEVDSPPDLLGEVPSLSQDAQCVVDSLAQSVSAESDVQDTDNEQELFGTESKQNTLDSLNPEETNIQDVSMTDENSQVSAEGCPGCGGVPAANNDMLLSLATSWPCVVSTVLGFYIAKQQKVGEREEPGVGELRLSPVHLLDSFTADLVLNADQATVFSLVSTIVDRMNICLGTPNCPPLDSITLNPDGLKTLTEDNQALFVGKRFLGSVVRVLALEHSRVKNTFSELQQMRERASTRAAAAADSSGSNVGGATVLETLRGILTSFSWLAVHHLAEAAEASSVPVRYGISKPLGASSVSAEYFFNSRGYNSATSAFNFRPPHQNEDPRQTILRQMHIRRAYLLNEVSVTRNTSLPPDGVHLHPESKEFGRIQDGVDLREDSFEDLDIESQEIGASGGRDDEPSSSRAGYAGGGYHFHHNALDDAEILIDLDPTSSDEEYVAVPMPTLAAMGTATEQEQSTEEIYPFAWALDGRRIGESESTVRPGSPSVSTFSLFNGPSEPSVALSSIPSIRFGAGFLARTFARIVKDLVDIVVALSSKCHQQSDTTSSSSNTMSSLKLSNSCIQSLLSSTLTLLDYTWKWATAVLDMAEAQLQQGQHFDSQRYVASLRGNGYAQGQRLKIPPRSFVGSTAGEYIVYLLRSQANEDEHSLPVVDLYGYEHVVYVLDSLVYSLAHWPKTVCANLLEQSSNCFSGNGITSSHESPSTSKEPAAAGMSSSKPQELQEEEGVPTRFFERTDSMQFRGSEQSEEAQKDNMHFFTTDGTSLDSADIFTPVGPWGSSTINFSNSLSEPCPLAQQPYLLKPNAKKEDLFKSPLPFKKGAGKDVNKMTRWLPHSIAADSGAPALNSVIHSWSVEQVLQRWHLSIGVFAHIFLAEGPGSERSNFLNARAGFASRMAKFRQQVSQLFDASQVSRDWASSVSSTFSVTVRRDTLLQDALEVLQQMVRFHYSQIRVKFEGEDGSGPGVNRGFFAALANAIKSSDQTKPPMSKVGLFFHEPGKLPEQSGFYTPSPFVPPRSNSAAKNSTIKLQRSTAFRAVGRYFGLCFWFRYTVPFMMCRHVAKYLLGRDLAWHDLAFYNVDLYEGMRRMMLDAHEGSKSREEFMSTYCCYFEAPIPTDSEPVLVELIPGGSKIPVTPDRVQEYVRLYATFVMVGSIKEELEAMKQGLTDIIPAELLSGLTAEDFQLLLSGGSANITLSRLKSVIRFNHTHSSAPSHCELFERMFWKVVSGMNNTQRQQLLYFATGTAALPATSDGGETAISITIDVIGSGNTDALPVASTCSQRMSLPLYPSYHILKKKLLQAIQCQAYGLG